jgi:hypothetical protein
MSNPHRASRAGRCAGKVGAILALASLSQSHQLAAMTLALIAGIYVGFAVQDGRTHVLATEAVVAAAFAVSAFVGLTVTVWAIPIAFALHGLWDLAHHRHITTAMPAWYIPFCAIYDWGFAIGLLAVWWPC